MKKSFNTKFNKILVINLGGIGDVILSTPALRALREKYPDASISVLTSPYGYEVAKYLPYIDEAFILCKNLKILLDLRMKKFDLAINMRTIASKMGALKMRLLLGVINPRLTAGRDTDGRGKFLDITIPETLIGKRCEAEYDIDLAAALGADAIDRKIDFPIDKDAATKVAGILKDRGISGDDIMIGIHPGGKLLHRWGVENFSAVIKALRKEGTYKFVITGAAAEVELADKLKAASGPDVINLAGAMNLRETAALIKGARLFISNDTGLIHIAAALKTPLVAIFGPGDLARFDPRHLSPKAEVMYKKSDCAPCNFVKCSSMKCVKAISPGDVMQASLKLLLH